MLVLYLFLMLSSVNMTEFGMCVCVLECNSITGERECGEQQYATKPLHSVLLQHLRPVHGGDAVPQECAGHRVHQGTTSSLSLPFGFCLMSHPSDSGSIH